MAIDFVSFLIKNGKSSYVSLPEGITSHIIMNYEYGVWKMEKTVTPPSPSKSMKFWNLDTPIF